MACITTSGAHCSVAVLLVAVNVRVYIHTPLSRQRASQAACLHALYVQRLMLSMASAQATGLPWKKCAHVCMRRFQFEGADIVKWHPTHVPSLIMCMCLLLNLYCYLSLIGVDTMKKMAVNIIAPNQCAQPHKVSHIHAWMCFAQFVGANTMKKMALNIIAMNLGEEDVGHLHKIFHRLDLNINCSSLSFFFIQLFV
jgi:hypothetical protein